MDLPEDVADIGTLVRRRDFLSYLDGDPAAKPAMVDDLDHSRSTVDRAIRALEDAGFVERTTDGYVTTLTGQLALERYDAFLEESEAILEGQSVLNALPVSFELPQSVITTAEIEATETQYHCFEVLAEALTDAEQYRAVLPKISDTRHIRMLHSRVVADDLDATVLASADVYRQFAGEFPSLAADLDAAESFDAREVSAADVGIVVATSGDVATVVLLVYETQGVAGLVRTTGEDAVSWARSHVDELSETASETTALGDAPAPVSEIAGQRIPARLRTQGFDRIDDQYFDNRSAVDPVTAWQAGIALPDVAAGYAFDRSFDDERSVTTVVTDRLAAGEDVALLGPPGSGKSTAAKQVAYEWFDGQRGPVFYRESGQGTAFDAVDALEHTIDETEGQTLVVVEDAARAEANAVFRAMQRFADREDVVFLLDARQSEWRDPDELRVDPERGAVRQEDIETLTMPPLDDREREAILDRFDGLLETDLTGARDQLLGDRDEASAGDVFLFFHRLTRYIDPLRADTSTAVTSLDEHVDTVRDRLATAGEGVLEVGVLVNALNTAGIAVYPDFVHALGAAEWDHESVREAMAILEGEVVFDAGEAAYDTVHDAWSVRFLQRLLDADGEDLARRRFGETMSALLALADDPERRAAVADAVETADRLSEIAADPIVWADETTTQLYELGRSYPKLAGYFGTVDDPAVRIPDAASPETALKACLRRGRLYVNAGRPSLARREYEHVTTTAEDPRTVPDPEHGRLYARALAGLPHVDHSTGEGDPLERCREAVAALEAVGDTRGEILRRVDLGSWLLVAAEFEAAREQAEQALELAVATDDAELEAFCEYGLGEVLCRTVDLEGGLERLQESAELAAAVGSRLGELNARITLSMFARRVGDLERCERNARRCLDLADESGHVNELLTAHLMLGQAGFDRGQFDVAQRHYDRAEELFDGSRQRRRISIATKQGQVAREQGEYETARERFETALEIARDGEFPDMQVDSRNMLALTRLYQDEIPDARALVDQAIELAEAHELTQRLTRSLGIGGDVSVAQGEFEAATEQYERVIELSDTAESSNTGVARRGLGDVARERGDEAAARERYEQALETFRESDRARLALEVVERLADLGDPAEWYDVGAEIAADAGRGDYATELRQRAADAADEHQARTD
jgi:tetratricopeptide (TPR) repeat protein/predicted transcriptional regulator